MKRQFLTIIIILIATVYAFAGWHKAELYYTNGTVARKEIHLPDETFTGIFNREIIVKSASDKDEHVLLKDISKVVLANGIELIKFDNGGKPVLLKQVTSYPLVNILVLEKHGELGSDDYWSYIYKYGATNKYYNKLPDGYDPVTSYLVAGNPTNEFFSGNEIQQPVNYYYSTAVRNGRLYTPGKEDYVYILKDNKIERLQPTNIYNKLSDYLGDDAKVAKILKRGVGNFFEFNEVIGLYNADKMDK